MCYSATASFVASGVLMAGSLIAIRKTVRTRNQFLYASIPVGFAVHQAVEGIVWLGSSGTVSLAVQNMAAYLYSFLAFAFWPLFIPVAMLAYEWPRWRYAFISMAAAGLLTGGYLLWCFTVYAPLRLQINCSVSGCGSIGYLFTMPYLSGYIDYIYLFMVTAPFLLSSNVRIRALVGPVYLLSFLAAKYLSTAMNFPSVWCFIAALVSILMFYALWSDRAPSVSRL